MSGPNKAEAGRRTGGRLRVAIFGAGRMGIHHAKAVSLLRNAELVAMADPAADPEVFERDLGVGVPFFRRAEDLLEIVGPDVVHVCTPPHTHAALAALALEHGAHVYVEKPFALEARDAENLVALAGRLGLKICAGHQLLFERPALEVRERLVRIGRVIHVESYFAFRPVRRSPDGRGSISPMDQLIDILPHPVYLLLNFLEAERTPRSAAPVELRGLEVRTSGDVRAIVHCGDITGILVVTLEGRPVESYVRIAGTNGSLFADFVRGTTIALPGPGAAGPSKILNPYSQAWQLAAGTTRALWRRAVRKQRSYPGLLEIIGAFYENIEHGTAVVPDERSVVETVRVCEDVSKRLRSLEAEENAFSEAELRRMESRLPPLGAGRGHVLVTGGAGMLGKAVAAALRERNWPTRVLVRRMPSASRRVPGVDYVEADLGEVVAPAVLQGVTTVVHCAAETAGGKEAHARNSVGATRNLIDAMAKAGVKRLIHVSSLAVLQTSRETGAPVDESTPLLRDAESRGPYVWGKAESERTALEMCGRLGIGLRIIRPGPLVDFDAFEAPGRLGREIGPLFIAVGAGDSRLSICDVLSAAEVARAYVEDFDAAPSVLNLVEPDSPTRAELVSLLKQRRPDLKVLRMPLPILRAASRLMALAQRLLRPGKKPIDIYGAFESERYKTDLAAAVIRQAERSRIDIERSLQASPSTIPAGKNRKPICEENP
jgi:predicted dehydrogenase/nucleoside-diphosphate-sugar epimerase